MKQFSYFQQLSLQFEVVFLVFFVIIVDGFFIIHIARRLSGFDGVFRFGASRFRSFFADAFFFGAGRFAQNLKSFLFGLGLMFLGQFFLITFFQNSSFTGFFAFFLNCPCDVFFLGRCGRRFGFRLGFGGCF